MTTSVSSSRSSTPKATDNQPNGSAQASILRAVCCSRGLFWIGCRSGRIRVVVERPDNRVEVVPYDDRWVVAFDQARLALEQVPGGIALSVEHIGSTVALAIEATFGPIHLNFQILGNRDPHVRVHIVPRYDPDPSPSLPLPAEAWDASSTLAHEELRSQIERLREDRDMEPPPHRRRRPTVGHQWFDALDAHWPVSRFRPGDAKPTDATCRRNAMLGRWDIRSGRCSISKCVRRR